MGQVHWILALWRFFEKWRLEFPCFPVMSFLGIYSPNSKTFLQKGTCALMWITALSRLFGCGKAMGHPNIQRHEWIKMLLKAHMFPGSSKSVLCICVLPDRHAPWCPHVPWNVNFSTFTLASVSAFFGVHLWRSLCSLLNVFLLFSFPLPFVRFLNKTWFYL